MTRRSSGLAAKAAGDAFESFVERQLNAAVHFGVLAYWQHNQPGVRVVGGRVVHTERSGPDFTGMTANSRVFVAEAKSTSSRLMKAAIKKKQQEQLDAVAKAGGLAYLLVEFRLGIEYAQAGQTVRFALPWQSVPWKRLRSAESIGPEDCRSEQAMTKDECFLARGRVIPLGIGGKKRVLHRE